MRPPGLALLVHAALHNLGSLRQPLVPARLTLDDAQRRKRRLGEPEQIEMRRRCRLVGGTCQYSDPCSGKKKKRWRPGTYMFLEMKPKRLDERDEFLVGD